ncbi:hypothetical protein V5O48_012941 [Marasmius crinis-equi]|uniref:GPI anchored protein n=1 Tax=Marasmius crinis-equi TaxID=585013 RepID=A0ABR3F1L7_9AGAR
MKTTIFGFLTLVPLLTQALIRFVPASEATGVVVATEASVAAASTGANSAETTYLIVVGDSSEVTTTVNGKPTTTTAPITNTIVMSAFGYKGQALGGYDMDCHYTDDKIGECVYVVRDSTTTQTATFSGTANELVVHVPDKAGGASQTSGGSGSSPSVNSTNGSSTSNDRNGATGMSPMGMGAMALGGLVLGTLAVF